MNKDNKATYSLCFSGNYQYQSCPPCGHCKHKPNSEQLQTCVCPYQTHREIDPTCPRPFRWESRVWTYTQGPKHTFLWQNGDKCVLLQRLWWHQNPAPRLAWTSFQQACMLGLPQRSRAMYILGVSSLLPRWVVFCFVIPNIVITTVRVVKDLVFLSLSNGQL